MHRDRELRHQHGKGPCNVFILDTSSSLGELGFKQMKDVFTSAIEEYAKHPEIDENVAVIVCGKETKFLRYFSNHYEDIKYCLDEVDLGGPSPLSAAFYLSNGCFMNGASRSYTVGEFNIQQRIILISGGRPTDFTSIASKDNLTVKSNEVFKNHLQELTREIGKVHPIFCIPVGINPDLVSFTGNSPWCSTYTMLEFICYQSRGGKIVHSHQARQFAKYSQNMDDIYEICSKKSLYAPVDHMKEKHLVGPDVLEERNPLMPPLGSRVKRGRDWIWNDQDGYGPGTVIMHCPHDGWLGVEWDTGLMYNYRYGTTFSEENVYDVQVCNEPRILGNKSISSGCEVKRGTDCGGLGDPFSSEAVKYREEMMRTPAALIYPSGASASHNEDFEKALELSKKSEEETSPNATAKPILHVVKGKYFRNPSLSLDIETDGPNFSSANTQWFWKDDTGKWNPYCRETNAKLNKCYKRNPKSTAVVNVQNQTKAFSKGNRNFSVIGDLLASYRA
uniref:Putative E3 ubiquitin-protein ligase HERC2 n=1 Tax=Magallana gigas TaxID=29159 RepID=K1S6Q6_MAGGI